MSAFLGKGLAFPLRPNVQRELATVEGPGKVEQSIRTILDTEPGERVMRPTFGCGLRRYLAQPNTVTTRALIERDVRSAITAWEPRIELTDVRVEAGDEPALVFIVIRYIHTRDRRPNNLVYPFYLE